MAGGKYYMKIAGLVGLTEYDGSKSWFELRGVFIEPFGKPSQPDAPNPGKAVAAKDMVDGGWQLISQSLSTAPKDVTIVLVRPDDRSEYKVSGEVYRCEFREARIVGTPTWKHAGNTNLNDHPESSRNFTYEGEKSYNFITFVLASPRVRLVGVSPRPTDPGWASLRATSLFQRSATA